MKSQGASAQAVANGFTPLLQEEERRNINSELWHACAGPLVSLPTVGSLVVYFPQGHSEQVAASMQKGTDTQIPSYPNLPPMLICQLLNLSLHADGETDEVYAQMTLQPVNTYNKDAILTSDLGLTKSKHPTEFFCKTLTASDTSTHGGFSVPRRSAEKIFPPLDFTESPPAQEIVARDLHDNVWTFRHIYRGQPKRHLLTTGWSVFVSAKRLFAGDSVLFIRDEKQQLLLGIRRANRQQPAVASSVLSSDSMHIGVLAAAAHAASNQSPFTVFYNPRASPSEFVIPLSKYNKAIYGTQVSLGMRFRMMFETEESGVRRYMGTITGISDLDSIRWPNSQWRNIQVGWDESSAGEKRKRVSIWEIEPVATPFFICPPPFFRPKRPRPTGFLGEDSDIESAIKRSLTWYGDDMGISNLQSSIPGVGLMQWMNMQQRQDVLSQSMPADYGRSIAASALQGSTMSKVGSNDVNKSLSTLHQTLPPISGQVSIPLSQQSTQQQQQPQILWSQQQQQQQQQPSIFPSHQQPQQQQQQSIHTQQQISSSQHLPQMDNHLQPQKLNQQLQSLTPQQLHQRIQQLQQSQAHAQLQSQAQATQQQQQLQRLQQLQQHSSQPVQQQPLQPQQNVQRLEQEPQAQQQQQNIHTSQQVHPYQTRLLPSPRDQAHNQYAQPAIMTSQHLQQPTQLPEVHGQMLQPNHNRAMAVVSKPQSGFPDSDLPSCSTSTSTNSYSLQNMISRPTHTMLVAAEEKPQICDIPKVNITSLQAANPTVTGDQHVNSLIPPVKESSSNTSLHNYVNAHLGQMEASSVPGGFSLGQSDISITQSIPLLSHESSPFLVRDGPSNNDVQTDSQRNSLSRYSVGKDIQSHLCAPTNSQPLGVSEILQDSVVQVDAGMSDGNMLQRPGPLQQPTPPMRTYTKVHKLGSVGRSIDVTRCKNYDELRRELARLFGLEGQLEDPQRSGWQLVFVDNENDVLLVGDDPWEEFVSCVRGIRILSPTEVLQMSQEGLELLNNLPLQQQACSSSDGAILWREHGDQNSNNPSAGSFDH